jgi:hypothetical protein
LIEKNWEMILIFSARFDVEYLNQTYKLNTWERFLWYTWWFYRRFY